MNNQDIIEKSKVVCRAYNAELERVFESLSEMGDPRLLDSAEGAQLLQRETLNAMAAWYDKPVAGLDETAAEFFEGLTDKTSLLLAYDVFSADCDMLLPECFQIQLGKFSEAVMPELEKRALAIALDTQDDTHDADQFAIQCVTIELLGQWENETFAEKLLAAILASKLMHERFASAIKAYFSSVGSTAAEYLMVSIEDILVSDSFNPNLDYLLVYLTAYGREQPKDRIYQILRKAFKLMPEKIIPVICLGDYGDGRAVAMLRAFLEKNAASLERGLLSEAMSSIARLGGNNKDLGISGL